MAYLRPTALAEFSNDHNGQLALSRNLHMLLKYLIVYNINAWISSVVFVRHRDCSRGKLMDVWYTTAKAIVRAYLTLFVDRIHVLGQREIPPGPKIIIANHTNVTDSFIVPFLVKEKVHFLIQSETFTLPVIGRMLALADQIPVYVGQGQAALDAALERLKLGHAVAIFPEGRLNDGKTFHRAGAGATVLALESGVPVIPLGFYVPDENARPIKSHFFNRLTIGRWQFGGGCFVEIGEPWRISNTVGDRFNYREIRRITENLMARVAELVQQAQDEARRLGMMK